MELIQAGFRPDELKFLCAKIRFIIDQTIKTAVEKYQIPIPSSTKAFIVPGKSVSLISEMNTTKIYSRPYRSSQGRRNILQIFSRDS